MKGGETGKGEAKREKKNEEGKGGGKGERREGDVGVKTCTQAKGI